VSREWIPVDIGLPDKPEILEIMDVCNVSEEFACWRFVRLWGWFSLNTTDGTARATPERLARACGGDADFWLAAERVGWLAFDHSAQTATVPNWEKRFSKSAKARAADTQRKFAERRAMSETVRTKTGHGSDKNRTTEEEEDSSSSSSPSSIASQSGTEPDTAAAWPAFLARWNAGAGERFLAPRPPVEFAARLAEPGWMEAALLAIDRLPAAKFFRTPVNLPQFCRAGFADDLLAGKFNNRREHAQWQSRGMGLTDKAPPREFVGDDAARFAATQARLGQNAGSEERHG
jgi:hypothetical protein